MIPCSFSPNAKFFEKITCLTWYPLKRAFLGKEPWVALSFTIFLFIFEFNRFTLNYRETFELIYDETLHFETALVKLALHLIIGFFLTLVFVGASLLSAGKFKVFYFLLFSFILGLEYGYQKANNNFMALYDLHTALNSIENWGDAISGYFNPIVFLPILLYGGVLLFLNTSRKHGAKQFGVIMMLIFGINTGIYFYTSLNPLESRLRVYASGPTFSLPAFFRTSTNAILEQLFTYHGTRNNLSFQAQTRPQNNIVFIIDESVREDHLSLNGYRRPTTPYLEQLAAEGVLYNWGRSAAGSTCSYRSVALLLTGVTRLPDEMYRLKRNPTIFQYAKAMNYKTFYLDGESKSPRFPLTSNDFEYIDEWLNQNHIGDDYDTDFRIADQVAELLQKSVGNFVVIFKRGLHFPYSGNFPPEAAVWQPVLPENQIVSTDRVALVNSYDNSIRYNLDPFFQKLLTDLQILTTTTILYTSDHGQTLGEKSYPHCGNTKNEAAVPLFMITNELYPIDEDYKASHHNTFATLLDLMGFPTAQVKYEYTPSLLTAKSSDSKPRYFFHGSLFGFDDYEWLEFD